MAKERTDKSRYQSRFAPDTYVSAAQLICEIIVSRKAALSGKDLPIHYWRLPEWEKEYKGQIPSANKLVKKYGAEAVLKALADKRCKRTYSLRGAWFIKVVEEYHAKAEIHKKLNPEPEVRDFNTDVNEKPRQHIKKNILDKLDELDNG